MYKLTKPTFEGIKINTVIRLSDGAFIPFDPANQDFANFKKQILADEAQLQDADGNVMAKDYVLTLP